jgi:branched-chain amino acid transport system ATP-binding protein
MSEGALLRVSNVSRRFGGLIAVNNVTFSVKRGEVLGLIGPNGSGKSTLLAVISGRLSPSSGEIRMAGRQIAGKPPEEVCRSGISGTFQLVRVPDSLDARDNVAVAAMYGRKRMGIENAQAWADELLERVQFCADPGAYVGALTYFDQKRVELARALACDPEILLLDEWLAGLNPSELEDAILLVRKLADEGITIVLVEHVMHAIRSLCSRVVVLNAGAVIAEGGVDETLSNREVIRVYLGEDA